MVTQQLVLKQNKDFVRAVMVASCVNVRGHPNLSKKRKSKSPDKRPKDTIKARGKGVKSVLLLVLT